MASLTIDLRSVVDKFTVSGPRRCAICNRDFDGATTFTQGGPTGGYWKFTKDP